MRKLNEDTSLGVHVSLYQVKDLHHPQKQYKVDVNARQLYMTGNAGGVKNKVYKFLPI
jgi:U4/U6 small nuclear ribonucleoprotein PRP3